MRKNSFPSSPGVCEEVQAHLRSRRNSALRFWGYLNNQSMSIQSKSAAFNHHTSSYIIQINTETSSKYRATETFFRNDHGDHAAQRRLWPGHLLTTSEVGFAGEPRRHYNLGARSFWTEPVLNAPGWSVICGRNSFCVFRVFPNALQPCAKNPKMLPCLRYPTMKSCIVPYFCVQKKSAKPHKSKTQDSPPCHHHLKRKTSSGSGFVFTVWLLNPYVNEPASGKKEI